MHGEAKVQLRCCMCDAMRTDMRGSLSALARRKLGMKFSRAPQGHTSSSCSRPLCEPWRKATGPGPGQTRMETQFCGAQAAVGPLAMEAVDKARSNRFPARWACGLRQEPA